MLKIKKFDEREDLILDQINHSEFGEIKVCIINEKYFLYHAKDVAKVLGYRRERDAIKDHVDKDHKLKLKNANFRRGELPRLNYDDFESHKSELLKNKKSRGAVTAPLKLNNHGETFITESGLYELILNSKMPNAKRFRAWIVEEVIPSIRKKGYYSLDEAKPKTLKQIRKTLGLGEEDEVFKYDFTDGISRLSRLEKRLKGFVLRDYANIYNRIFHTNLTIRKKYFKEKHNLKKTPNTREFLDLVGATKEGMIVMSLMLLKADGDVSDKKMEYLTEMMDYLKEKFTETELLKIEAKSKKFWKKYKKEIKEDDKKNKRIILDVK